MLIGSEAGFKRFEGFPPDFCAGLTSIEFEYVEFEPAVLTKALEGCESLESLHFHDVEWIGNFSTRVVLPNLRDFKLFRSRGLHEFDKQTLKSLVFFDKSGTDEDWKVEEIHMLGTNITTEHFVLNHQTRHVFSSLEFTADILKNFGDSFQPRSLTLEHIEVGLDSFPESLESLKLHGVEIPGRLMLDEVLQKTVNLKYLELLSPIPNVVDMSHLPISSLESLSLTNLEIIQTMPTNLKFERLKSLSITSCLVHPSIVPESITNLLLEDAFIHEGDYEGLFRRTKNLGKLMLRRPTPSYLDISTLPTKALTDLRLENINLFQSRSSQPFGNLSHFLCHDCNFDSNIVKNFHNVFRNVETFDLWMRNLNLPVYELLSQMIYQTAGSKIVISDLERVQARGGREMTFGKVENFLHEAGVPEKSMTFVIEKNMMNGSWHYLDPLEAHPNQHLESEANQEY